MRQIQLKGMMKTLLWAIASIFFTFSQSTAQNTSSRIIKGKVTSSVSEAAVPGATVSVKGTQNSVSAGDGGEYSIYAQTGDVLVSFLCRL